MIKLICGRSRAGKTTYAKQFYKVMHLDSYGIGDKAYARVINRIKDISNDLIIEGIYDTKDRRISLLDAYKGSGERVCIWIDTPIEVIDKRFHPKARPRNLPHSFEPPTFEEGWNKIVRITDG